MFYILLFTFSISNHVTCNPIDLIERLNQSDLIPKVIRRPPNKICTVTYGDIQIEPGQFVTPSIVEKQPSIIWHANKSDLYCLHMTGTSDTFLFKPPIYDPEVPYVKVPIPQRYQWLQWAVGNIPGDQLEKGDVLRAYTSPKLPGADVIHEYLFFIFKQLGPIKFVDLKVETVQNFEWSYLSKFRQHYNICRPAYGNFFRLQGPPGTTTEADLHTRTRYVYESADQPYLDESAEYHRKYGNATPPWSGYFDD